MASSLHEKKKDTREREDKTDERQRAHDDKRDKSREMKTDQAAIPFFKNLFTDMAVTIVLSIL